MAGLIEELKRRNIFRVGLAYAVVAWFILQLSSIVAPNLGLPEWTMPFLIFILAVGFPLVLIFAWAFELTPDGLKRSAEIAEEDPPRPSTGKRLNQLTIGVLGLAVALLLADRFFFTGSPVSSPSKETASEAGADRIYESIAVLPFVNMSDEKQREYFSDGISEELLNLLAKIRELRVAARTSSFAFKGKNMDIKEIARQLNVETVLEGSVRLSGAKLRITAQLIDAGSGYHLWSETYDRELTDVFAIQDEISGAIVEALQVHLVGAPVKQVVTDVRAYDAFLRGRQRVRTRQSDELYSALSDFATASQIDPDYAAAHAATAETYVLLEEYGGFPKDQAFDLAQTAIEKALVLDPNLADAQAAKGLLLFNKWEFDKALVPLNRAIELAPNMARAYNWRGISYREMGYPAKALQDFEKAHALDPLLVPTVDNLYRAYFQSGRDDLVFELYSKSKARARDSVDKGLLMETYRALYQGDYSGAFTGANELENKLLLEQIALALKNQEVAYANLSMISISPLFFGDVDRMRMLDGVPGITASDFGKVNTAFQHVIEPGEGSLALIFELTKDLDRSFGGLLFGLSSRQPTAAVEFVGLWREAGQEEEAKALADQLRAYIAEMEKRGFRRGLDYARAALKVYDGDHDGAMAILEEMASYHGLPWFYDWLPALTYLHDRDDFQRLFDDIYKHINSERAELGWEPVERTVVSQE